MIISIITSTVLYSKDTIISNPFNSPSAVTNYQFVGQSFIATADGTLSSISFVNDSAINATLLIFGSSISSANKLYEESVLTKDTNNSLSTFTIASTVKIKAGSTYIIGLLGDTISPSLKYSQTGTFENGTVFRSKAGVSYDLTRLYTRYIASPTYDLYFQALISPFVSKKISIPVKKQLNEVVSTLNNYSGNNIEINNYISSLIKYSGDSFSDKLEQSTSIIAVSTPSVNRQVSNNMSNIISSRQNKTSGINSGDITLKEKNLWVKPFASKTNQNDVNGISGFDANSYGIAFGTDIEYKEDNKVGISTFLTRTKINSNHVNQTNDIKGYSFVVYGNNPFIDRKSKIYYQLGMGIQKNSTNRYIYLITKTAKATYNSKFYFAMAKITRDYSISDNLSIIPNISSSIYFFKNPAYSETGAAGMNLKIESFDTKNFVSEIGTSINYEANSSTNFTVSIAGTYDFNTKAESITSSYEGGGTKFATKGIENSSLGYKFGLELTHASQNDFSINLNYNLIAKTHEFKNHAVATTLTWKF